MNIVKCELAFLFSRDTWTPV